MSAPPLARGLTRRVCGAVVSAGTAEPVMALTFDDGPDPASTPRILEALARHGMKATFFLVGARARRHPGLVARIAAEGHAIGNHSWDHPSLPTLSMRAVADQIRRTRGVLAPHGQRLLRPPYGHQDPRTHLAARLLGYRVVAWSAAGEDWRGDDAETVAGRILARAAPGAIVLLHDTLYSFEAERFRDRDPTIAALGILAARLPGTSFVTVPELLRLGRPVTRHWRSLAEPGLLAGLRTDPADGL